MGAYLIPMDQNVKLLGGNETWFDKFDFPLG